ncbi:MAG: GlmU family protein [Bacteroidota bacterium]
MKQIICLFEDEGFRNLLPLVYTRPVYDLQCGMFSLSKKILTRVPNSRVIYHTRGYLAQVVRENEKRIVNDFDYENILFINGRVLIDDVSAKIISKLQNDSILTADNSIVAAKLTKDNIKKFTGRLNDITNTTTFGDLPSKKINIRLINYPWDLIKNNIEEITADFEFIKSKRAGKFSTFKSIEIQNKKNVIIEKGVKIDPFAFLDASYGPIYIGKNAHIMSHSSIQGPAYIGNTSVIKMHASIYHGTSIGDVCKVGGEVENSIIHSYSNKQHEGFLGHSYLGSWINIGASTNNSDLKNNYSIVEVPISNKLVSSGLQFVGLIMGDHSKTSINSMFNTGSVVGVCCNIFGNGFPNKYLPSFSWGGSESLTEYRFDKAIEVIKSVMARRNVSLSETGISVLKNIFDMTSSERNELMNKK